MNLNVNRLFQMFFKTLDVLLNMEIYLDNESHGPSVARVH